MNESPIKSESPRDRETLRRVLSDCFVSVLGKDPILGDNRDWLVTLSYVARDSLAERLVETGRQRAAGMRHVNYLSMEFLIGRVLINNLLALDLADDYRAALHELGITLEDLRELEPEPGLGNGGLGRLAACFLDSLATLRLPAFGYGIRYQYGTFVQLIRDGYQTEHPDEWLAVGNPWEFPRPELAYTVRFGGRVERQDGVARWLGTDDILAVAYDTIIPGYATRAVATLRGRPSRCAGSTWRSSISASTRERSSTRCGREISPGCSTPTTAPPRAASYGCDRNTSLSAPLSKTSCGASSANRAGSGPSPRRRQFTSMTRTPRSPCRS